MKLQLLLILVLFAVFVAGQSPKGGSKGNPKGQEGDVNGWVKTGTSFSCSCGSSIQKVTCEFPTTAALKKKSKKSKGVEGMSKNATMFNCYCSDPTSAVACEFYLF